MGRASGGKDPGLAGFDVGAYVPRALLARTPDAPRRWSEEGTLVFADISGFTRLSDQLARRGREGAEDLISTLVRIFTLLLSASDDGGDLIKFGGDAMAIHYAGPDHERRACHSAWMMQRMMQVIGNVELIGARARLRMSVGVHSATFDFLLPGDDHQDLVLTGAGVTRTLELEAAATPGEILVSPETAAGLPASNVGPLQGVGHRLRRTGAVASTGSQILFRSYDEGEVWRHLPTAFRERPDLLAAGSDHRRAAMAFVQVTGLDAAVARDPDEVLTRMDRLAKVVGDAAAETGISVLDTDVAKDGYKYFLAAGAPTALEDPEGRMLRALLRITGADVGLDVRAGCAAGRVFAGTVGAPFRCSYAAMGDTTNLAARLCGTAGPGEVVAHAPLLDRSLTQFDHGPVSLVELKGKPEPVPVVTVHEVLGQRGRALTVMPFVGRETELARIADAFAGVRRGDGAVVELIGEAGIGKSRLADNALARLDVPVLTIGADPYGAFVPYQTLRSLLRALLGLFADSDAAHAGARLAEFVREHAPDVEPWLPLLAPAVGATLDDAADDGSARIEQIDERFRAAKLHEAVRDLLTALMPAPTALLIDDAQWVDESSADALGFAFADLRGRPWAVALTRRDGDDGLHGGEDLPTVAVRPLPLPVGEAESLVSGLSAQLRHDELEAILGRGGGNPYFLLQLARGGTGPDLPESVEELVGLRIDALDAVDRELLRDAAVLGNRFPAALYVAATGDRDFPEAVRSPALAPYLRTARDGWVAFQRDLYREVAYGQLAFRKRRQLHLEVARAIEEHPRLVGDARLPMLSLHYHQAGVWDRAREASLDAAQQAREGWANEEAVQFYRRAYDAGRRLGVPAAELRGLGESIGDVLQVAGRFDDAMQAYRDSLRASLEADDRIRLMLKIGRMLDHEARFTAAARLYRRARMLAAAPPLDDPVVAAEIDVADASSRHLRGRNADGRDLALRAWETVADVPPSERVTRIRARAAFMHDTCAGFVDGPRGTRFGDMPLRMFEAIGDHYYAGIVANNLGIQAFESGRWTDATAVYTQGREYCRRAGDRVGEAIMDMNIGEILGYQGHLDEAEALLEAAGHVFTVHQVSLWYADCCAFLAAIALQRGDLERARALLDEAARLHAEHGASHAADHVAIKRLDLLLADGDLAGLFEEADALLHRRHPLEPVHQSRAHRALGAAHLQYGDPAAARTELETALRLAREMESHHDLALAHRLLAECGGPDAAEHRAVAEATYRELGIVTPSTQPA